MPPFMFGHFILCPTLNGFYWKHHVLRSTVCSTERNCVANPVACQGSAKLPASSQSLTFADLSDVDHGRTLIGDIRSVFRTAGLSPRAYLTLRFCADFHRKPLNYSRGSSSVLTRPYAVMPSASLSSWAQRFKKKLPLSHRIFHCRARLAPFLLYL